MAGTTWDTVVVEKIKARGGGDTYRGTAALHFGPSSSPALPADAFLAEADDGTIAGGTYAADAKGKIAMTCHPGDLGDAIAAWLYELAAEEGLSLSVHTVTITSQRMSGRANKGVLKLKLAAKFQVTGTLDGRYLDTTGSYTAAAVGAQE